MLGEGHVWMIVGSETEEVDSGKSYFLQEWWWLVFILTWALMAQIWFANTLRQLFFSRIWIILFQGTKFCNLLNAVIFGLINISVCPSHFTFYQPHDYFRFCFLFHGHQFLFPSLSSAPLSGHATTIVAPLFIHIVLHAFVTFVSGFLILYCWRFCLFLQNNSHSNCK